MAKLLFARGGPMLSLKRCREILGLKCTLTDPELEVLRDQLYALGTLLLQASLEARTRETGSIDDEPMALGGRDRRRSIRSMRSVQDALKLLPEEACHDLEERAAICEFDGGLRRDEAERAASLDRWGFKVN